MDPAYHHFHSFLLLVRAELGCTGPVCLHFGKLSFKSIVATVQTGYYLSIFVQQRLLSLQLELRFPRNLPLSISESVAQEPVPALVLLIFSTKTQQ